MYVKYQSLIENDIWKYKEASSAWIILKCRLVFKIKENWWDNIL